MFKCLPIIKEDLFNLGKFILGTLAFLAGTYVVCWWIIGAPWRASEYIYSSYWWFLIWPVYGLIVWGVTIWERCPHNKLPGEND